MFLSMCSSCLGTLDNNCICIQSSDPGTENGRLSAITMTLHAALDFIHEEKLDSKFKEFQNNHIFAFFFNKK